MKKFLIVLFCVLSVNVVFAGDHCTDPDKYTIDKRCYVTDEQKQEKPYNAVVGFIGGYGGMVCTGTIVKSGDKLFVYTAKHCVGKRSESSIRLTDGTITVANVLSKGNYTTFFAIRDDFKGWDSENPNGDWAILGLEIQGAPYVNLSSYPSDENAISLGYGQLKVMSDQEIADFKDKYIYFLETEDSPYVVYDEEKQDYVPEGKMKVTLENKSQYGLMDDGILTINGYVRHFLDKVDFDRDLFDDNDKLKVSYCKYNSNGESMGCQGWQGDSGGGLFDSNGDIMGIRSSGKPVLGGNDHAGKQQPDGYIKWIDKTE